MIETVINEKNRRKSKIEVYQELKEKYKNEGALYPEKKALGSCGGSKTQNYIADDADDYVYVEKS